MRIRGKTILVTGASSGLGRGLAEALSHGDNNLVLTARREALLQEVAEVVRGNGSRCTVVAADATDPAQVQAVVDAALRDYGHVDIAVLNAGGGKAMSMADASADDVLWIMRTNFDTLVLFLSPLIAHMKGPQGKGGLIAYTGSPAGFFGLPRSGPYSAAKAAGRVLIDSCRVDLAKHGIDFVALYPGFTYTDAMDPDEVPIKALIIERDRAVREMLGAIERRTSHHLFPKRIGWLIQLGRLMPEWLRRFVLGRVS